MHFRRQNQAIHLVTRLKPYIVIFMRSSFEVSMSVTRVASLKHVAGHLLRPYDLC